MWTGEAPSGSAMVLPTRHRRAPWDLSDKEWTATRLLLRAVMEEVDATYQPDGWNVGWNVGEVGGQSIPHAHCHVIPRYFDEPFAGRGIRAWIKSPANQRPTP